MKVEQLNALAGGTVLKIADDGGFMAGHACKFGRVDTPHTAAVVVKGKPYSVQIERLVKHG